MYLGTDSIFYVYVYFPRTSVYYLVMLYFIIGFILGGICGAFLYKGYLFIKRTYLGASPILKESQKDMTDAFNQLNKMTREFDKMNQNRGSNKRPY